MGLKALLFDFDGVILDSLDVKKNAFYNMYLPYGKDIAERVIKHHLQHGGISRYEKFRIYHEQFLGIPIHESDIKALAQKFGNLVVEGVIQSKEVKHIREFLTQAVSRYKMWIITGTPTEEIKYIAQKIQIDHFFIDAFGSPQKKDFWVKKIMKEHGYLSNEVVFIGDAWADYEAACSVGIPFVLRTHPDNQTIFEQCNQIWRISDFKDFNRILVNISEHLSKK